MMQPDDPAFLTVGTEVSAKYKGAFCEAKVNKVLKNVKVKVTFKFGQGANVVSDDNVKGILKVGAQVKALHNDKNQYMEAVINKIQDCSQYTVVFDDGDITTLRRNSLCLKSGRHFAESETLDQLPLTHPEHFGTPVVGGRRGRRSRPNPEQDSGDESSSEDEALLKKQRAERCQWQGDIGKVVCVETGEKKKQKDNWFPGLVVAPTAQDTVNIDTKKDFLVRSFQDGRYYTVPKKETQMFNHDNAARISQGSLRAAVDKALEFLDAGLLPPHWDRDILLGHDVSEAASDKSSLSNTSDDETREEKDHFVAQLYKYMEECGTPLNKEPMIGHHDLDLYKLYKVVTKQGGFNRVMNQNQWKVVANKMGFQHMGAQAANLTKAAYKKYLQTFEGFYRKLGCTMVSSPRGSRMRHRSGRSLIRDCDRTPRPHKKDTESCESTEEEMDKKPPDGLSFPLQADKKEEPRASRSQTPSAVAPVKAKALKSTEGRRGPKKEPREDCAKKSLKSDSEEDSTTYITRSLRNREEGKEENARRPGKRIREHERSASSTSTSSATSTSSCSKDADWAKGPDRRFKTRGSSVPAVSKPVKMEEAAPCLEDVKPLKEEAPKPCVGSQTPPCSSDLQGKRTRKKTTESRQDHSKFLLPPSTSINVGDKLLVLYGPNNKESKITYEAKVLKLDENNDGKKDRYYVHYLGWNTRYDEWVDRTRIAQNVTQKSTRANTGSQKAPAKQPKPKESWPTASSRGAGLRARSWSQASKDMQPMSPKSKEATKLSTSRDTTDSEGVESGGDSCSDQGLCDYPRQKSSEPPTETLHEDKKEASCGKDIDLKAIESEMKGLDKMMKKCSKEGGDRIMTTVIPGSLTIMEKKSSDPKRPNECSLKKVEIPVRLVPAHEVMGQIKPVPVTIKESSALDDDIYEFREPEPFDLCEIRSRKDPKPLFDDEDMEALPDEPLSPVPHAPSPQEDSDPEFSVKKEAKDYTRKSDSKVRVTSADMKPLKCEAGDPASTTCQMEGGVHTAQIHSPKHCLPSPDYSQALSLNDPAPLVVTHSPPVKSEPVALPLAPEGRRTPKFSEAKVMPFAQRQQHIFPHLLSRPDLVDDKKDSPKHALYATSPSAKCESQSGKCDEPTATKTETTVEESIEAVVQRARQEKKPLGPRPTEKRRKNIARHKKPSRDHLQTASSEDSDCNSALDDPPPRSKRLKSYDGSKHSPKRLQRLSTDAEKKLAQQCEDEERANDADEEDNESTVLPGPSATKEAVRRRKPFHHDATQDDVPISKHSHKRRRSALRYQGEDSEETGLGDLLCEETFLPGSPMTQEIPTDMASSASREMPFASVPTGSGFTNEEPMEAPSLASPSPVSAPKEEPMEVGGHTPPSTPDSSSTNTSHSPLREEPVSKNDDTSKSGHYSSEMDFHTKMDALSEGDSNTMDSCNGKRPFARNAGAGRGRQMSDEGWDTEEIPCESPRPSKMRKLSPKSVPEERVDDKGSAFVSPTPKRKPKSPEEHTERPVVHQGVVHNPKIYTICPQLHVEMGPEERIAVLENFIKDLRKKYQQHKAELSSIERRRKKLRRKEKEKEAARRQLET